VADDFNQWAGKSVKVVPGPLLARDELAHLQAFDSVRTTEKDSSLGGQLSLCHQTKVEWNKYFRANKQTAFSSASGLTHTWVLKS